MDDNTYIKSFVVCSIIKPLNQWKCLYTPFPIWIQPWESISLEYFLEYPFSKTKHDTIFVVVYKLSKIVFFIPCKKTMIIQKYA